MGSAVLFQLSLAWLGFALIECVLLMLPPPGHYQEVLRRNIHVPMKTWLCDSLLADVAVLLSQKRH